MTVEKVVKFYFDSLEPIRSKENVQKTKFSGWLRFAAVILGTLIGSVVTVGILPICLYRLRPRTKATLSTTERQTQEVFTQVLPPPKMSSPSSSVISKEPEKMTGEQPGEHSISKRLPETLPTSSKEASINEEVPTAQKMAEARIKEEFAGKVVWVSSFTDVMRTVFLPKGQCKIWTDGHALIIHTLEGKNLPVKLAFTEDVETFIEKLKIVIALVEDKEAEVMGPVPHNQNSDKIIIKTTHDSFTISGDAGEKCETIELGEMPIEEINKKIKTAKEINRKKQRSLEEARKKVAKATVQSPPIASSSMTVSIEQSSPSPTLSIQPPLQSALDVQSPPPLTLPTQSPLQSALDVQLPPGSPTSSDPKEAITQFFGERASWIDPDAWLEPSNPEMERGHFKIAVGEYSYRVNLQTANGPAPFKIFRSEDVVEKLKTIIALATDPDIEMMSFGQHDEDSLKIIVKIGPLWKDRCGLIVIAKEDASERDVVWHYFDQLSAVQLKEEIEKSKGN